MSKLILPLLISAILFSCDKVDCPNEVGCAETSCQLDGEVVIHQSDSTLYKKVLMEEFTGFACTNCPEGARLIEDLKNKMGDTLTAVSVHAGWFADPNQWGSEYETDFRTEAGNEYEKLFGINKNPIGVVEQKKYDESYQLVKDRWAATIRDEVNNAPANPPVIQLTSYYSATSKRTYVNAKVIFRENTSVSHNLILLLIEDGVVDVQLDGPDFITDYVHRHVLRGSLGPALGQVVNDAAVSEGEEINIESSCLDMSADWDAENCEIVAILYNPDGLNAVQTQTVHIK